MEQFERTSLLLGEAGIRRLLGARVAVFGVGGVGGYAVEALARSGVGGIDLFDDDRVCLSNLNRQIIATHETIGRYKVDVMAERILQINPDTKVERNRTFYLPETADAIDLSRYSYIVDAVDTVAAKLELAVRAHALGVPLISAMGAGNKLDPTRLRVADIYETSVCPLARVMRRELKRRGVDHLKVVYSTEMPVRPMTNGAAIAVDPAGDLPGSERKGATRRDTPGSTAFVPSVMGLIIAGEIIRDLALAPDAP